MAAIESLRFSRDLLHADLGVVDLGQVPDGVGDADGEDGNNP